MQFRNEKKKFARLSSHIDAFARVISQDQEKSNRYSFTVPSQKYFCLIRTDKLNGKLALTQSDKFPRDSGSRISAGGEIGSVYRLFRCDPLVCNQNYLTETNTSVSRDLHERNESTNFSLSITRESIIVCTFLLFSSRFIIQ